MRRGPVEHQGAASKLLACIDCATLIAIARREVLHPTRQPAFLHHEPATLFFDEVEFLRSGDFCGCPVWCAHVSKELLGASGPSIPTARSKKRGLCLFGPAGGFEGSKSLGQGSMESLDPTRVVHLRAQRNANNERLGNLNVGIVQMPRARIDPRLRYFARLLEESEQGDTSKS
jgi:hypothetical protein